MVNIKLLEIELPYEPSVLHLLVDGLFYQLVGRLVVYHKKYRSPCMCLQRGVFKGGGGVRGEIATYFFPDPSYYLQKKIQFFLIN